MAPAMSIMACFCPSCCIVATIRAVRCSDHHEAAARPGTFCVTPTPIFRRWSRLCGNTGCRSATRAPADHRRRGTSYRLRLIRVIRGENILQLQNGRILARAFVFLALVSSVSDRRSERGLAAAEQPRPTGTGLVGAARASLQRREGAPQRDLTKWNGPPTRGGRFTCQGRTGRGGRQDESRQTRSWTGLIGWDV